MGREARTRRVLLQERERLLDHARLAHAHEAPVPDLKLR
jgi:hypothetical protein